MRPLLILTLIASSAAALAQDTASDKPLDAYSASQMAAMRGTNYCSGLWQGGLDSATIDRELNDRDASFGGLRDQLGTEIDREARTVSTFYAEGMPPRISIWRPVLGCALLPAGAGMEAAQFLPQVPESFRAPDLDDREWPTGDRNALSPLTGEMGHKLAALVESAFDGVTYGGRTWGIVVVSHGRIVAERYAVGFGVHIGSQTHSAAKSFTSSLIGIAQGKGILSIEDDHLLAQWSRPGDPRATITLEHLLHMASGLNTRGIAPPYFMGAYTQGLPVTDAVAGNFLSSAPGSQFVYSPADTMLIMRSLREAMNDDQAYLRFPYENLFWKIGMTRTSMNSDWDGNFFGSGQAWSTARDFARFGLLYLHDGMWGGRRVLPAGWAKYVATQAPVQPAAGAGYGAQFWLYGPQQGLPEGSFTPSGGQGQYSMVIPSEDLVVVRRGVDLGADTFDIARFSTDVIAALDD